MLKKLKVIIPLVLVLIIGGLLFASNYLVDYAIARQGDGGNRSEVVESVENESIDLKKDRIKNQTREFLADKTKIKTSLVSRDNINLTAFYYTNNSENWAILVHGYRTDHKSMEDYIKIYHDLGYNVLLPDLRGSGESGGKYIGMGWLDRLDIIDWINHLSNSMGANNIVLHGNSMGAATVLMASGETLPNNVKAIVEDSGYTSVKEIFSSELKLRFNLPEVPLMNIADVISKLKAGYTFNESSTIDQVRNSNIPTLFIHGKNDDFVPFEMMEKLYDSKSGDKEMLISEDAGHVESLYDLGDEYIGTVTEFILEYSK